MDNKSLPKLITVMLALIFLIIFFSQHLFAGQGETTTLSPINWKLLIFGMLGGLALFLYGMGKMSEGMKKAAGNRMRNILSILTHNRFAALILGAVVTMVIQSSSATTVMLVTFVQAGLMTFSQTLGVILGADIGTTVTAQLIAFNVSDYALLMIAIGFGFQVIPKEDNLRNLGEIIFGFGVLFYGMKLMSDTMEPLRGYEGFINVMKELENPLIGLLVGTVFTLAAFHFSAGRAADGTPKRLSLIEGLAWVGRVFIAITLGALFAGVYMASLTAMIERLSSIIDFFHLIRQLIGI